jgi:hypothetical protein
VETYESAKKLLIPFDFSKKSALIVKIIVQYSRDNGCNPKKISLNL